MPFYLASSLIAVETTSIQEKSSLAGMVAAAATLSISRRVYRSIQKGPESLPVLALMDAAHITCVANDFGYHAILSRSVAAFGKKGDILIALSTSGNSANVREAIVKANEAETTTIVFLGRDGGDTRVRLTTR